MISIRRHPDPIWYRVQVLHRADACTLAMPVRAHSLQEAREQVLERYRDNEDVKVLVVERRPRLG